MLPIPAKRRNAQILFGIGFLIGILLEITLIEKGKLAELYRDFYSMTVAEKPAPKVACVVFLKHTHTDNIEAGKNTWMTYCDETYVIRVKRAGREGGIVADDDNDKVCDSGRIVNVTTSSAWSGLCKTLHLLKKSQANWFILSPDNLLILVNNLKQFVKDMDWEKGYYYGYAVEHFEADYNVLSAGVLISQGTLRTLLNRFSERDCERTGKYWKNEDVYLGKYLREMDIFPKDTRDEEGRGRFHGYNLNVLLSPGKLFKQSDYTRKALFPVPAGMNCCSPGLITIDATNSDRIYHHYYLIYKLKTQPQMTTQTSDTSDDSVWKQFLRSEGYNETYIQNITSEEYYKIWSNKITPENLYNMMRKEFGDD